MIWLLYAVGEFIVKYKYCILILCPQYALQYSASFQTLSVPFAQLFCSVSLQTQTCLRKIQTCEKPFEGWLQKHIHADILPIFREGNDCCFCSKSNSIVAVCLYFPNINNECIINVFQTVLLCPVSLWEADEYFYLDLSGRIWRETA